MVHEYKITLLPSVTTLIARGMFRGTKYTHHVFTPFIKHLITTTTTAAKQNKKEEEEKSDKKSFIDNNMRKCYS